MVKYSWADIGKLADKSDKRLLVIVRQSTNDLLKGIKIAPGINRGGSRQRGVIPRDLVALAGSLQSSLSGTTSLSGPVGQTSWVGVIGSMQVGDKARFAWGGLVAPYAAAVHFGSNGVTGTFWIDVAKGKWPEYVRGAIVKAKAAVR